MSRRFYTIFILPHAHARFRKIHVSRNFLLLLAGILLAAIVAGAVTPHLLFTIRARSETVASLEAENRKLRAENGRFEASLARLGAQINAFETGVRRLASAVGLKDLPSLHPAVGGGSASVRAMGGQEMLQEELDALRARAGDLGLSLEQLNVTWQERMRLLASTPHGSPVQGSFSDGFGWRKDPFTGIRAFHEGLDIVAPAGTAVRATADGVVTRVGRQGGYGKLVQISHGYGLGTLYGHLSTTLAQPGQRVRRGEIIGRVGSTGRSTGPHVHYEVHRGGRAVDPGKFLAENRF